LATDRRQRISSPPTRGGDRGDSASRRPRLIDVAFDRFPGPVGLGEPATTVVGHAIGNAIFTAVGARCATYRSRLKRCAPPFRRNRRRFMRRAERFWSERRAWRPPRLWPSPKSK
jgi:hypothetical protein